MIFRRRNRTLFITLLALLAFAANSLLCRMALLAEPNGSAAIDAASFTTVRVVCGALSLLAIIVLRERRVPTGGSWGAASLLFLYAATFSFAYTGLSTGTGALLLFASVQLTMLLAALRRGERPHSREWLGIGLSLAGMIWLVLPGLSAPPLGSALLMLLAGIAWGGYTLYGSRATQPLIETAGNFLRAVPITVACSLLFLSRWHVSGAGLLLAALSGALASGVGYVIWYAALRGLTTTRAALVQLAVPVLAALGGVAVLAESITVRLAIASLLVLGGIALAIIEKKRR